MELPNPPHRPQVVKSKIAAPDEKWNRIVRNITRNLLESVLTFLPSPEKESTYEVPTSPDKTPDVNNGTQTWVPPLALSAHVSLASCFHQIPSQLHCGFKLLLKQEDAPRKFISRCAFWKPPLRWDLEQPDPLTCGPHMSAHWSGPMVPTAVPTASVPMPCGLFCFLAGFLSILALGCT